MSDIHIWHNPKCSKSRLSLQLLRDHGIEPQIQFYKEDPPSIDELQFVAVRLEGGIAALIRKKEAKDANIDLTGSEADLIRALHENPAAIERPIVISGEQVVLGRPPENLLALIGKN